MSKPISQKWAWVLFLWAGGVWIYTGFSVVATAIIIILAVWYHQDDLRQWGAAARDRVPI